MRTFKFRVWDKDDHVMYHDVGIGRNGEYLVFGYDSDGDPDHWFNATTCLDMEPLKDHTNTEYPFEVMQFTGLHDKNGTEIYEWDIVSVKLYFGQPHFEVIFVNGQFLLDPIPPASDGYIRPIADYKNFQIEVIGNIYEKPELLKEEVK